MPPRKRISNIAKLLPRKRTSTPVVPTPPPRHPQRDCTSLPAGFCAPFREPGPGDDSAGVSGQFGFPEGFGHPVQSGQSESRVNDDEIGDLHELELRDHRDHRFAQRFETNQLPCYHDYPKVEEDVPDPSPQRCSYVEEKETIHVHEECDIPSLRHEVRLLRDDHALLSETARETLRLAEALEARIESMQRSARPSERLFWLVLDGVSAVFLLLFSVIVRPWGMVKRYFVADRVAKRRSWRISVGDFENDPFLGDVAKRLSVSAADD